jgi:hypothetical protein
MSAEPSNIVSFKPPPKNKSGWHDIHFEPVRGVLTMERIGQFARDVTVYGTFAAAIVTKTEAGLEVCLRDGGTELGAAFEALVEDMDDFGTELVAFQEILETAQARVLVVRARIEEAPSI